MEQKRQQALNLRTNEFEVLVTHVENQRCSFWEIKNTANLRDERGKKIDICQLHHNWESAVLLGRPLQRWS